MTANENLSQHPPVGTFGVWARRGTATPDLARELERLGYGAVWVGGSPADDLANVESLLDATTTLTVATGIVNIWNADPAALAASYHRIEQRHPGRLLLGIGTGHRESTGAQAAKPFAALVDYLDVLDAEAVPRHDLVLAALGPRVLRLAAERTAGAHPYLVTPPAHEAGARDPRRGGAPRPRAAGRAARGPRRGPGHRPTDGRVSLPRVRQLSQQPQAPRLYGGRPGRRGQRPAHRRTRRVWRRSDDRASAARTSRCRCRPCRHPAADRTGGGPGGGLHRTRHDARTALTELATRAEAPLAKSDRRQA
ncbi:MAG: LLM class flavin-dependent oxidoreductase [Galbitalea sp.]